MTTVRPTGMLFGLASSLHPFSTHRTVRAMDGWSLQQKVAELRRPDVRARLLAEEPCTQNRVALALMTRWGQMFPLGDPPDYEPPASASVAAVAEREGRRPEEVVLDWLLEHDGRALLFAPLATYVECDHEAILEMITHPRAVVGLSESLRMELHGHKIGVSVVCPGYVKTPIQSKVKMVGTLDTPQGRARVEQEFNKTTLMPETVAARTLQAIRRNEFIAAIGREAFFVRTLKRWAPSLLERALRG